MLPGRAEHVRRTRVAPRMSDELHPAGAPGARAARGGAPDRDAALAAAGAGPAARRVRAGARPAGSASSTSSAVSSGTAGLHLAIRAAGVERRRRGRHDPVQLRRLGQLPALRGRAPGLLRHRPAHAQHRPRGRGGRGGRADQRASARSTSSATRPTCRRSSRSPPAAGCGSSRTPARRSAPFTATERAVGARGNLAVFGFYPNKQLTTGEGGAVVAPDADGQGAHRQRAQPGARARHGLARPRPARLQLPALGPALRARARPARAARRAARRARARGGPLPRGARRHRGPRAALRGRRRRSPQLVRLRGPAAARRGPRRAP